MTRILAIDHGTKRIGLAVTDHDKMIAFALETVPAHELVAFLKAYLEKEEVEGFVIGLPVRLDGSSQESTERVEQFVKHIRRTFKDQWVKTVDERFTSSIAQQTLIASGVSRKKRRDKGTLDRISATLILQSYLEQQNGPGNS